MIVIDCQFGVIYRKKMASCRSAVRRSFSEKFSDNFTSSERNYISLLPKEIRDELFRYSTSCNYRLKLCDEGKSSKVICFSNEMSISWTFCIYAMRAWRVPVDEFVESVESTYGLNSNTYNRKHSILINSTTVLEVRYESQHIMVNDLRIHVFVNGVCEATLMISSELMDILWHIHDLVSKEK